MKVLISIYPVSIYIQIDSYFVLRNKMYFSIQITYFKTINYDIYIK